jgi:hypothetical protein
VHPDRRVADLLGGDGGGADAGRLGEPTILGEGDAKSHGMSFPPGAVAAGGAEGALSRQLCPTALDTRLTNACTRGRGGPDGEFTYTSSTDPNRRRIRS